MTNNTVYRYLGYGVTNENGVAKLDHDENGDALTHSYTGVGAGEIDVIASLDDEITESSIVSEPYPLLDALYYDTTETDTTSRYFINSTSGTAITYENSKIKITCGTEQGRNGVELRSGTNLPLSSLTGKTIKFSADLSGVTRRMNAKIIQTVDGSSVTSDTSEISTDGTITSYAVDIDPNATLVRLQIIPYTSASGDVYYSTNWKVWVE